MGRCDLTGRPWVCHDSRGDRPRRASPDATLAAAVDARARRVLDLADAADVGEHLGPEGEGELVVTHLFACTRAGYLGWHWSVTLTRAARQQRATVDEVVLIPGDDAIVAPPWVPYRERIQPGDLSPGDLLPVEDEDPRLVPTYSFGDDPLDTDAKAQVRQVAQDLGLGRVRTLSPEGIDMAAQRWYDGDGGPEAPLAKSAPETCWSCGFLVRLTGPLAEHVRRLRQRQRQRRRPRRLLRPRLRRALRGQAGPQAAAHPGARPRLRHAHRRRVRHPLSDGPSARPERVAGRRRGRRGSSRDSTHTAYSGDGGCSS